VNQISIIADTSNDALAEIVSVEIANVLREAPGVELGQDPSAQNSRLTGLELVATIVTSAAALELARAVRDAVKKRGIELSLKKKDGTVMKIVAKGDVKTEEIVKFVFQGD
jgi:outer membrane lipoprotein SlyB